MILKILAVKVRYDEPQNQTNPNQKLLYAVARAKPYIYS